MHGFRSMAVLALSGCRAVVDPGVSYHDCPVEQTQEFGDDTSIETLQQGCWQLDNADNDPTNVFVHDGDLVIRTSEPIYGRREQWAGADQAPMFFTAVEKDFLLVARIEAVHKLTGDQCLPDGNMTGLVLRQPDTDAWATFLVGPFDLASHDCVDDSGDPAPMMGVLSSRDDVWGSHFVEHGAQMAGIGDDGEVDMVACRVQNTVAYYYRDPAKGLDPPAWIQLGEPRVVGSGPIEVGMTASGADPNYAVEAHVDWAILTQGPVGDGCRGALEALTLPESP
jgi:hypothetical protein